MKKRLALFLLCLALLLQGGCPQIEALPTVQTPEPVEVTDQVRPESDYPSVFPANAPPRFSELFPSRATSEPTPSPEPLPTPSPSPRPTPSPTPTPSASPRPTPTPSAAPDINTLAREEAEALIPNFSQRYYLRQLEGEVLADFCAMYRACCAFEENCTLPYPIARQDLFDLHTLLVYECPELIQFDSGTYHYYWADKSLDTVASLDLPYLMDEATYRQRYRELNEKLDQLCDQVRGLTPLEQELFIYDYIIQNCVYNSEAEDCSNAYGTFVRNRARCEGRCKAVKLFLERLGIPCICISTDIEGEDLGHSWNIVQLNGTWYDIDTTVDDVEKDDEQFPTPYGVCNVAAYWMREREGYQIRHAYGDNPPGTNSMSGSYHASLNRYALTQDEALSILLGLMDDAYWQGGGRVSIQVANSDILYYLRDNLDSIFTDWAADRGVGSWHYYYHTYNTACVLMLDLTF